jgi:hypothetical protein
VSVSLEDGVTGLGGSCVVISSCRLLEAVKRLYSLVSRYEADRYIIGSSRISRREMFLIVCILTAYGITPPN